MIKNHKGFSTFELLIVILVIGLIASVGWYIVKNNQRIATTNDESVDQNLSSNSSNEDTVKVPELPETKGWKTFTKEGISLKYPDDWQEKEPFCTKCSPLITIASSNFREGIPEGGRSILSGAEITIGEVNMPDGSTADNFHTQFPENTGITYWYGSKNGNSVVINDKKVFQYKEQEENNPNPDLTTIFFMKNDTYFNVSMQSAVTDYDKHLDTYNLILKTVSY